MFSLYSQSVFWKKGSYASQSISAGGFVNEMGVGPTPVQVLIPGGGGALEWRRSILPSASPSGSPPPGPYFLMVICSSSGHCLTLSLGQWSTAGS